MFLGSLLFQGFPNSLSPCAHLVLSIDSGIPLKFDPIPGASWDKVEVEVGNGLAGTLVIICEEVIPFGFSRF
jgi:hypothetical protein